MIVKIQQSLRANLGKGSLLTASALLFISMTSVNAGNYLFNLILGRWLGPANFAELSLIVTLMLVFTFITSTLQTLSAKFAARHSARGEQNLLTGLRHWLARWAWVLGFLMLAFLALASPFWQSLFQTASVWPFILLALGLPLYFRQGVDRGILQGQTRFGLLALTYQAEMWVRLLGATILVALGLSVNGGVIAITLSFIATWLVAHQVGRKLPPYGELDKAEKSQIISFTGPVLAALMGQILINNSDILIVKHFFVAEEAGRYAALALIGRIVFFATWSIVTAIFPVVAQKHEKGEAHRHLLAVSFGLVGGVSALIIAATVIAPDLIVKILFGDDYLSIAPYLWLYGLATMFFALANVIIYYRLSLGNRGGSYLAVVAGVAQVVGLLVFHSSILEVVLVQVFIMAALLVLLLSWDAFLWFTNPKSNDQERSAA